MVERKVSPSSQPEPQPHVQTDITIRRRRKRITSTAVAVATLAALVTPVTHLENTKRVLAAEFGQSISCIDKTPASPGYQADVIAVPGATSHIDEKGVYTPNLDEAIRLSAAVADYQAKLAPNIVLMGGQPSSIDASKHLAAEITFLQNEALKRTGAKIPESVIFSEKISRDTTGNMEQLAKIMDAQGFRVAAIETSAYHAPRATVDACKEGIAAFSRPAESTLQHDPTSREDIIRFHKKLSRGTKFAEKTALLVDLFTP